MKPTELSPEAQNLIAQAEARLTEGQALVPHQAGDVSSVAALSRDHRSILLYAETCLVDGGGLMAGTRMNTADIAALKEFQAAGILEFGRIPFHTIDDLIHPRGFTLTHWVRFGAKAWAMAHELRRQRWETNNSTNWLKVEKALAERAGATA